MAVANKPELLIADEPTTALDGALNANHVFAQSFEGSIEHEYDCCNT